MDEGVAELIYLDERKLISFYCCSCGLVRMQIRLSGKLIAGTLEKEVSSTYNSLRLPLLKGKVKLHAARPFGDGRGDEVGLGDHVAAGECLYARLREVMEQMLGEIVDLWGLDVALVTTRLG